MKNRISKRNWRTVALCVMLIAAMAISLAACKQQGDANVTISLSKSSMQLDVYETFVLTAEVTGSQETPVWTVEDSSVATVDNGTVTAVQEGTTVVTATVGETSASCSVQVVNSYVAPVLMVNTPDIALGLNESYTVEVGVRYNGEAVTEPLSFNWELCDDAQEESVSLVPNERGAEITALSYGTTAYTVSTTYRGMVLAQRINIKVTNLDITFDIANLEKSAFAYKAELGLFKTDKDITEIIPVVTVYDKGVKVEDPTITWISLDQDIATVSEDGRIVGVSAGTARIVGQYDHAEIAINAVIYRSMVEKKNVDVEQATGYVLSTSRFAGAGEVTDVLFNGESVLKEIKDGALYLNDEMLPSIGKPVELSVIAEKAEFVTEGTMATFVINSESELNRFPRYAESYPNGYYILGNDIQCGGTYSSNVTEPFLGTFDGRGHAIYNFTTSSENRFGRGLFGETFGAPGANEATIKDIAFINANHSGTGAMIAQIGGGLMENVYINVSLTDLKTGGGHSSTTVLFSYMYGSLETKQVLIEHNIPMVNVGETGYALTNLGEYGKFSGLYIIGADNVYHDLVDSQSGADRYGAYPTYRDFIQSGRSMGGWGNTFWATIGAVAYPRGRNIHASYMPTVTAAAETLSGTTVAIENLGFLDEVVLSTATKKLGVKVENNLIIIPEEIPDDSVLDITVRSVFNHSNAVKLSIKVDYAKQMMLDEQVLVSKRTAETFRIDLSCFAEELEGFLIQSASVDGKNFSSVTYADGMLTLDTATLGDMVEEGQIFANFAKGNDLALVKINIFASDMAICSAEDLQRFPEIMQKYPSGYYILGDDIDYTGYTYTNNNDVSFTGIFDGRGYTIYNLRTKTSASDALHGFFGMNFGLEGAPQHSATLRNISFVGATVWGKGAFLAMNGSGTLENVFVYCTIEDLVADVHDPNPWYNSTSILFNKGKWYLTADKVIVEYKEPLTDNNGWGYAVGFPDNVGEFDNFYVVGADQYYGQLGTTSQSATNTACYANRADFVAAKNDLTAWDGNGFWTVVDGYPIPNRLVGVNLDKPFGEPVELAGMTYVDTAAAQATFTVDFGAQKTQVKGAKLTDASVEGKKFTTMSYADGILTLDFGTVSEMTGEKTVTLTFEKGSKEITVHAKIVVCTMIISNVDELSMFPSVMKEHPDGYYALDNDIDMAGVPYSNSFEGDFTGTFDGQGYTIYNLCTKTSADDALHGFFGENFGAEGAGQHTATLKNISFVDAVVWGRGSFLAMNGSGTLENVYMNCTVKDLFADVNDPNPWYNSTSVLFNKGKWYLTADKVIVEYAEPLTNNNGWGYAVGFPDNVGEFDNFYVVGADQYYGQLGSTSQPAANTACYADRTAFGNAGTDFSAWYATGFWAEDPATKTPVPASQVVFNDYNDGYAAGTVHDVTVRAATRKFVSGGSSDYTVVAAGDTQSQLAATYLIGIVKNATGVTLSTGAYSGSGKHIVINDANAFAAAGLSMPETDLGTAGYYIVTSNDNVFIMTGKETGAQNAVLAFLKHVVGMEVYGVDTVVFTKTGETMPDMVIIEKPDIPNHMMGNWRGYYETAGELSGRYLLGYTHFSHQFLQKDGADNHTSMLYLPYNTYGRSVILGGKGHSKWYSKRGLFQTPSQLCYNAQGDADELAAMVDEAATQILNELNKAENAAITMGQFSIMDNEDCCNCDACKADLAKYGSNNGAVVEFMNLLSAEIQERLQAQADEAGTAKREFTLYLMAYNAYEDAPSMNLSEIHFHENLGVIYAPIGASYTHSFYESQNADVATNMRNWATLSDHLYYWLYETNFRHYMIPHDSWTTSVENLRFAYECDADIVMIQGQHNQSYSTGFTALKVYLNSVAGQNVNAMNDGGYQRAVNSFFANYYGKGGNEMQQLFEELQAWMNGLSGQYTGQINSGNSAALANAAYWPKDMLVSWLSLVEKAETDAAGDAKALKHIRAEGIFIRYMLIEFYGDTYSASELAAMKSSFKEDCAALGIVKATEFDNVADLWS